MYDGVLLEVFRIFTVKSVVSLGLCLRGCGQGCTHWVALSMLLLLIVQGQFVTDLFDLYIIPIGLTRTLPFLYPCCE